MRCRTSSLQLMNNPLIIVCGPTATGKTEYALKLAREKNGELVSADSRQIYKYLNIGTGKDLPPHSSLQYVNVLKYSDLDPTRFSVGYYPIEDTALWLYDVITPDQKFSAYEYARTARTVMQDVWNRGKTPILVGGTGLYIQAAVDGLDGLAPADWKLREKLGNYEIAKLQATLNSLNPLKFKSINQSDRNNPRRLIRAIEISSSTPSPQHPRNTLTHEVRFIGLIAPREELYKRIDERVEKRIQQGMLDEIKSVLKMGYSWDDPGLNTIGYKQLRAYFENKESLEEAVQKWKFAEHEYARRQITWFKKDKRIEWVDTSCFQKKPHIMLVFPKR